MLNIKYRNYVRNRPKFFREFRRERWAKKPRMFGKMSSKAFTNSVGSVSFNPGPAYTRSDIRSYLKRDSSGHLKLDYSRGFTPSNEIIVRPDGSYYENQNHPKQRKKLRRRVNKAAQGILDYTVGYLADWANKGYQYWKTSKGGRVYKKGKNLRSGP